MFDDIMVNDEDLKGKFFNLSNDLAFKVAFQDKKILSLFLSSFWNKKINEDDIIVKNSEVIGTNIFEKRIILDVNSDVLDENTIVILNLEMQRNDPGRYDFLERCLYYFCRNKSVSLKRGKEYNGKKIKMTRVESVVFTGFDLFKEGKWHYPTGYGYEKGFLTCDRIHFIVLPNFLNCHIIELEEILKCFTVNEIIDSEPKTQLGREAYNMLEKINSDEDLKREMYKAELYEYFEEKKNNELKEKLGEETKRANQAEANVLLEREKTNQEKARADEAEANVLLEQARTKQEREKNIQIVKRLYEKHMPLEFISEVSNLEIEEIKKIIE